MQQGISFYYCVLPDCFKSAYLQNKKWIKNRYVIRIHGDKIQKYWKKGEKMGFFNQEDLVHIVWISFQLLALQNHHKPCTKYVLLQMQFSIYVNKCDHNHFQMQFCKPKNSHNNKCYSPHICVFSTQFDLTKYFLSIIFLLVFTCYMFRKYVEHWHFKD